jgi:hypothetical protein
MQKRPHSLLTPLALTLESIVAFGQSSGSFKKWGRVEPQSRQSAKLFLQSSELVLPQPLTRGRVCPPPLPRIWGGGAPHWRERGWESPNSNEGTYTVVLLIYTYFVGPSILDWAGHWTMWEVKKTTSPLLLSDWSTLWTISREVVYGSREKTWRTNYVLFPRS